MRTDKMDCENVEKYKEQYLQYSQYSNNFAYRHLLNKAKKLVNGHIEKCPDCQKNGVKQL